MPLGLSNHGKGGLLCLSGVLILTPDTLLIRKAGETLGIPTLLFFRYGLFGLAVFGFLIARDKGKVWLTMRKIGEQEYTHCPHYVDLIIPYIIIILLQAK
jgi:hypothetical protein